MFLVVHETVSSRPLSNQVEITNIDQMGLANANAKCSGLYTSYDKVANAPGAYVLLTTINNYRSGFKDSNGNELEPLRNAKCDEAAHNAAYWFGADLAGQFDGNPKALPLSHTDSLGRDFSQRAKDFGLPANSGEALFYGENCIDVSFLVWKSNTNEFTGYKDFMLNEKFTIASISITYIKAEGALHSYLVMVYTSENDGPGLNRPPTGLPTPKPVAAAAITETRRTRKPIDIRTKKPKKSRKPKNKRKRNKKPKTRKPKNKKPRVKKTRRPREVSRRYLRVSDLD